MAHAPWSRGAGAAGREPPGHAPCGRADVPPLGGIRVPGGATGGLRRQAGGPASRVDGCALPIVGTSLSGQLGRRHSHQRAGSGKATGSRRVPLRGDRALAGGPGALGDGGGASHWRTLVNAPRLYLYGDDDLAAARRIDRFAVDLATEGGGEPLERLDVTGQLNSAGEH